MKKNQNIRAALTLLAPTLVIFLAVTALISCQTTSKKKPVEEFIVHWGSPQFQIGEIEVQMDPPLGLGSIKKQTITVLYSPTEDAVILRHRQDFTTYQQCWSRNGRQVYIEALQKYNEDYDKRALDIKDRKSKQKYATVKGYLIWQQFQYTIRARGIMNIELGYTFKDKAPYFIINQLKAEYIDAQSRDNSRTSMVIPFYFTRAQAAELAALFDHDFIDGLNLAEGTSRFNANKDQDDY